MKRNDSGIVKFLLSHAHEEPVSFHMPGHKGRRIYKEYGYSKFIENMADYDITEIEGADNLFQAESIIKETMEKYRELYNVKKSYLLVNGTSCGLIAAVLASVSFGGSLIMARNCHKSVFNALSLGHINPVYAHPQLIEEFGISGEITKEEIEVLLDENPQAEAVILPSPNYYGICSDIGGIAEVVHRAGKLLIVDQAHGAHLKFFADFYKEHGTGLPRPAEECGADIVVNSIHKTLASFTQSAVMNVVSERVDLELLEDKLQCLESTSPSYLLMGSLDVNADILTENGRELIGKWHDNLTEFYSNAESIKGLKLINTGRNMDWSKINLDMSRCGISGHELEKILIKNDIYVELVTGNIVMCMSGIGNIREDYMRLLRALQKISEKYFDSHQSRPDMKEFWQMEKLARSVPKQIMLHPIPSEKQLIELEKSEGWICASSIIPYPPGIPLVCPGEVITRQAIDYISALRAGGEKVIGINEKRQVMAGRSD